MKRRMFKELYAIWPYGVAAVVGFVVTELASAHYHTSWEDVWGYPILGEYVFFLLAGSILFGSEFSDNTMERLLSQPVLRAQIWNEKIRTLALVILPALAINLVDSVSRYIQALHYSSSAEWNVIEFAFVPVFVALIAAGIAISTAPMMALYTRKTHTAFFASLILPVGSLLLAGMLSLLISEAFPGAANRPRQNEPLGPLFVFLFASVWCAATYYLARRCFLNLEIS